MRKQIVVICGPTAVGKTKFAIEIARALDGEIVSADSMQLYRLMNIGSAKPTKEEMERCPHHLVDCIDPKEPFSVSRFRDLAKKKSTGSFGRERFRLFQAERVFM